MRHLFLAEDIVHTVFVPCPTSWKKASGFSIKRQLWSASATDTTSHGTQRAHRKS